MVTKSSCLRKKRKRKNNYKEINNDNNSKNQCHLKPWCKPSINSGIPSPTCQNRFHLFTTVLPVTPPFPYAPVTTSTYFA